MELREVVGQRVEEARRAKGLTQDDLGVEVGRRLARGRPWPKQIVSAIERGKRDLSGSELVAVSAVLDRPASWFLTPPDLTESVTLGGRKLPLSALIRVLALDAEESALGSEEDLREARERTEMLSELILRTLTAARRQEARAAGMHMLLTPRAHPSWAHLLETAQAELDAVRAEIMHRARSGEEIPSVSLDTRDHLERFGLDPIYGPLLEMIPEPEREARAEALAIHLEALREEQGRPTPHGLALRIRDEDEEPSAEEQPEPAETERRE
jgi:transcriptional regulator with XRE-family HTH domain